VVVSSGRRARECVGVANKHKTPKWTGNFHHLEGNICVDGHDEKLSVVWPAHSALVTQQCSVQPQGALNE
jgi:hypothetical protein